ncbi:hypothetical protein SNEBB_005836 [Seison nebaliae]|nr:hypothetical protein SNEBB_005836 [Seison nebaliae]
MPCTTDASLPSRYWLTDLFLAFVNYFKDTDELITPKYNMVSVLDHTTGFAIQTILGNKKVDSQRSHSKQLRATTDNSRSNVINDDIEKLHEEFLSKATAEANNLAAKAMAREFYMRAMEQHCGGDKPYMHPSHLQRAHCQLKEKAMSQFTRTKKMGGTSLGNEYFKELENELNELLQNYIKHNQSKNVFSFSRTAYTLIFMMAISYLFGSILDALFLGCFAVMFTFLFWISFILLAVWIYCKYSGEMREVGEYIDFVADIIFSNVMFPLYSNLVQRTIQNMVTGPCCTKEDGKKIN